jgi:hypothetical protein
MRDRRAQLEVIEVADEGHAPLLEGDALLRQIVRFVDQCEVASRGTPPTMAHGEVASHAASPAA